MENEYLKRIYGLLESGATLGTGAVSGLVGLPYGLYKGVTSGAYGTPEAPRIAAREAQQFMERNTYQPRTAEGQANLQQLAGLLEASKLPPVIPEASLLAAIPKQAYAAQAERAGMAAEKAIAPVVTRTMERGGLPAQLLGDLSQGSIRPMDVWHGTPHGPFPKFDSSKIGTGEGAQAYGHGIYTGEARGTGEGYRKQLTNKSRPQDLSVGIENTAWQTVRNAPELPNEKLAPYVKNAFPKATDEEIFGAINKARDHLEEGYLYKVDLPDEAIANMLDWDKPVSKQTNVMTALRSEAEQRVRDRKLGEIENEIRASLPKQEVPSDYMAMFSDANAVQNQEVQAKALSKLNKMDLKSLVDKELDSMKPVDMNWNMTGKEFYELLSKREGGAPKASEIMQKQGVPGIRYLDQGSRNYESGTSNFVVFPGNEDLLKIKEINDKPYEQWFPKTNLLETAEPKAAQGLLDTSYRGSHTAPGPDFGAPLYDLTGGGQMYPADVYSSKAAQYYGTGYPKADKEAFALANKVRGNPDAEVTMYRAVPKDASIEGINKGDWVTLSKDYAKNHGESVLDNNYKIISQKVKAKDLWTNADSIHEFGYWPE